MLKLSNIMPDLIGEGVHDPNIFKAVFIVGSPGAGKTTIQNKLGLTGLGLKLLDPDIAMVHYLKTANLALKYNPDDSETWDKFHAKSTAISGKFKDAYKNGMLGLVITGTGSRLEKITNTKKELELIGYQCYIIFVNCDLETAIQRNASRDRTVDEFVVKQKHAAYMKNIGVLQRLFSRENFLIIDTSDSTVMDTHGQYYHKQVLKWLREPITDKASKILNTLKQNKISGS